MRHGMKHQNVMPDLHLYGPYLCICATFHPSTKLVFFGADLTYYEQFLSLVRAC